MPSVNIWRISRPRFRSYIFGPFLVGTAAGIVHVGTIDFFSQTSLVLLRIVALIYFLFPANLLIYGVNDIADYATDQHNEKKQQYEELVRPAQHSFLMKQILYWNIPFLCLIPLMGYLFLPKSLGDILLALGVFVFLGVGYSQKPIRAKVIPFLDGIFNFLYIAPSLVAYAIITGSVATVSLSYLCAGLFWVMAMHAYSAIPDIQADTKAKISTVATILGYHGTLLYCGILYMAAGFLSYDVLGGWGVLGVIIYWILLIGSYNKKNIMKVYRVFPWVNILLGFLLFRLLIIYFYLS